MSNILFTLTFHILTYNQNKKIYSLATGTLGENTVSDVRVNLSCKLKPRFSKSFAYIYITQLSSRFVSFVILSTPVKFFCKYEII